MSTYIKINDNLQILDGDKYVKCIGILRNENISNWLKITLDNGQELTVTSDHPFITEQGKTIASDLLIGENLFYENEEISIKAIEDIEKIDYSYDVETESGTFSLSGIKSSNCRTANGFDINGLGQQKDGRGNICPVTVILPTIAMESKLKCEKTGKELIPEFMKMLDKKICEAKDMLLERFEHICSQSPASAKFMWENNTMAGYVPEEGIRSALKHGTLALGQLGLAECLQILIGCDHTTDAGMNLAKEIESLFKARCAEFKESYKLNFGVYYTPAENLCYTALKKFRSKYGIIKNVSDKEWFTNSIHVPVQKNVDPFEKIGIESKLTGYSSAGCITYVELPSTAINNIDAVETIVNYAMDHDIPYFALNFPLDSCNNCYAQGDFNGICPECGSKDIDELRRVTGYLSTTKKHFNKGKQDECDSRIKHIKH